MFHPTYLYIKQHSVTKKCYFGKTTSTDPETYLGSGKVWKAHIRKHGKEFVETLWFKLFTDRDECMRIALLFSEQQNIVESDLWLNIIPENGIDGGPNFRGKRHSEESRIKMSKKKLGNKALLGFKHSEESRSKMHKPKSAEHRAKISESLKGNKNRCIPKT